MKDRAFYISKQKTKEHYIRLFCAGKITQRKCASLIGCSNTSVVAMKKRYLLKGHSAFINGHTGHKSNNRIDDVQRERIVALYQTQWKGMPIKGFCEMLQKYHGIKISYQCVLKILREHTILPPRTWHLKPNEHKPRKERERAGELVQMDASLHDWFMNGHYVTLHGGIDDATHAVTGLYFCENECRLGYNEVLRQTWQRYGLPSAYYIDRHSSFVKSSRIKDKTRQERLEYSKNEHTHFVDLCASLDIEVILALSPQGKGRIERLWQTLQGKLPFIFRFLKIDTLDKANGFILSWLDEFNERFTIPAQNKNAAWRSLPDRFDYHYALSVKFTCKTDAYGVFTFHGTDFELLAPARSYKRFTLCLSEQYGLRAYLNNKWYDIKLLNPYLQESTGDRLTETEKDLIERYLQKNLRQWYA